MMDTPCEDLDRGTFEVTSSVQRMMMKRQQQQDNPTEEFREAVSHSSSYEAHMLHNQADNNCVWKENIMRFAPALYVLADKLL